MENFEVKKQRLIDIIEQSVKDGAIVAFSGGVDSSLILKMAYDAASKAGSKLYSVTLHTMLHPMNDMEIAAKVADEIGAEHIELRVDELADAGIWNNPKDRCYLCKKLLFGEIKKKAYELGVGAVLEGTNEDDTRAYRPGIRAIEELGVISPLVIAGITKAEVRALAAEYGISVSNRPAAPCLATRFPYGTELSYEKMRAVEKGEEYIKSRLKNAYNVRMRVHGELARIEVDAAAMQSAVECKNDLADYIKELGFKYVTLDLIGFHSGSMDE